MMDTVIDTIRNNNYEGFQIKGISLLDADRVGERINDVPVVATLENVEEYVCREWVDEVFLQNPGMNEVYPGDSRYILDAFLIYEGSGEWFDLLHYPINRESFSYGGSDEEVSGFSITDACIGCGRCAEACPQQCITPGEPYQIAGDHCLRCGLCQETCPVGAVINLND